MPLYLPRLPARSVLKAISSPSSPADQALGASGERTECPAIARNSSRTQRAGPGHTRGGEGALHFSEVPTEFGAHLVQDWSQFSGARHLKQTRINGRPWQSAATRREMPGDDCPPYHPRTSGKLVCFHETLKARLNLLVFTSPEALRAAIAEFIEFCNYHRYHEGIGNVTSADVYYGRQQEILKRRKDEKQETLDRRFQYNLGQAPNPTRGELRTEL